MNASYVSVYSVAKTLVDDLVGITAPVLKVAAHPNTLFSSIWSAESIFSPIWARCNSCICRILSVGHDLNTFVNRSNSGVSPSSLRSVDVDMKGAPRLEAAAGVGRREREAACDENDPPPDKIATFGVTNAWPTKQTLEAHAADNRAARVTILRVWR